MVREPETPEDGLDSVTVRRVLGPLRIAIGSVGHADDEGGLQGVLGSCSEPRIR
jgi:hypothetical protein